MSARSPDEVDAHVARRIAARRSIIGMSSASLAAASGVSLQQILKYETGANRVSASRLYRIAIALGCEPGDFFPTPPERTAA